MEEVKRCRTQNFTYQECEKLVGLVEKYKDIVENKKSDAITWKQKNTCWETIACEFNSSTTEGFRSAKVLRSKYETLKKGARKRCAEERKELFKTGGGSPTIKTDEFTQRIKAISTLSFEGNPSVYDSDVIGADLGTSPGAAAPAAEAELVSVGVNVPVLAVDVADQVTEEPSCSTWMGSVAELRTPVNPALKSTRVLQEGKRFKKRRAVDTNELFAELARAKLELVKKQDQLVTLQLLHQQEEHTARMKHMEKEHNAKMQLLEANKST